MPMAVPVHRRSTLQLPSLRTAPSVPTIGVDDQAGERWRGTAAERGYDSHWQRTSAGFRRKHPLCVCCEANGRVTATALVDHIIPHKGDKQLFWDRANWQALCWPCHRTIKALLEAQFYRGEVSADALRLDRLLPQYFL